MVNIGVRQIFKQTITVFILLTMILPPLMMMVNKILQIAGQNIDIGSPLYGIYLQIFQQTGNIPMVLQGTFLISIITSVIFMYVRATRLRNDDTGVMTYNEYRQW